MRREKLICFAVPWDACSPDLKNIDAVACAGIPAETVLLLASCVVGSSIVVRHVVGMPMRNELRSATSLLVGRHIIIRGAK